jgi:putative nucleotidyltransferase with HDIG domain
MQELDDFINRVDHLPPAPRILPQLLVLLGQPDIDSSRVVNLITYDPGLTASVLQLCNSAFFGSASPVFDLQEAVTRLGFRQVCQLVAAISGSRALGAGQKGYGLEAGELWKHSVATAVAARLVARDRGVDDSLAFTAALLHDIGKIILAQALEDRYAQVIEEVEEKQQALLEAEKRLLGVQHAEIGGRLLARWKFPSSLVAGVWFHHHPTAAAPHQKLASCVYLGNLIAFFLGWGYGRHAFALRGRASALEILGLDGDALPRFMIQTFENYSAIEALLHIP